MEWMREGPYKSAICFSLKKVLTMTFLTIFLLSLYIFHLHRVSTRHSTYLCIYMYTYFCLVRYLHSTILDKINFYFFIFAVVPFSSKHIMHTSSTSRDHRINLAGIIYVLINHFYCNNFILVLTDCLLAVKHTFCMSS